MSSTKMSKSSAKTLITLSVAGWMKICGSVRRRTQPWASATCAKRSWNQRGLSRKPYRALRRRHNSPPTCSVAGGIK
eukprot:5917104-Heterocapsa_arctica.AAC.1